MSWQPWWWRCLRSHQYILDVAFEEMELSRLYDDLCIVEVVDVKPPVLEREPSLEYYNLE